MKVVLYIKNPEESKTVELRDEITLGRTDAANVVVRDAGLSRVNTTIFRDGDDVLVTDENSTNGTFLNGEKLQGRPRALKNGDELRIGSSTTVRVQFESGQARPAEPITPVSASPPKADSFVFAELPKAKSAEGGISQQQKIIFAGVGLFVFAVVVFTTVLLLVSNSRNGNAGNGKVRPVQQANTSSVIPVRVVDPLGRDDENDLEDFIAAWETEEKTLDANDLKEISSDSSPTAADAPKLNVPIEFYRAQLAKALNHGATGAEPAGLIPLPEELFGGNVSKQKAKLAELIRSKHYTQPLDFGDLAQLKLEGKFLVELPMATNSYVLDIGGSASGDEFTTFEWGAVPKPLSQSPKWKYMQQLADNFDGQKYDLNNPTDRKQIRIRLLRMYNKDARQSFFDFMDAFYQQFKVPVRVTSLTRSMDYQIGLNKINSNSFKVSGAGSLPPHTSGCAFDISRKNLTKDEQNFMMKKLAELEKGRKLDSLREGNANACFHSFFYPDGIEPTNPLNFSLTKLLVPGELAFIYPIFGFFKEV